MKAILHLLLTLLLAAIGTAKLYAAELKVGDPAPSFELRASDGKMYKLNDFKGKQAVVIAWFPRAFTPGCTNECKSMKENGEALRKYDVAYFTASTDAVDGPRGNKAFAESLGVDYPILCDPKGETATAYGIYNADKNFANRVTFYIDREGRIAHVDKKVATGTHGSDVAKKLKELGVPERLAK
ncbi:MAG: peroxiredoxin [Pirellulales bacterium]|nr:peroxiredoxin [Pirellulales bacterium]